MMRWVDVACGRVTWVRVWLDDYLVKESVKKD